jgi:hypothetical protein
MTVPKMAKKTGGMAPKRKMKGGNPDIIKVGDQEYTVTVEGSKVCVEPKEGEPEKKEGEEVESENKESDANNQQQTNAAPDADADGASFGGKKGKKRTQKKKGKKPRKSAKKAKK